MYNKLIHIQNEFNEHGETYLTKKIIEKLLCVILRRPR
jgi:hypothetical protein